jgi:hypothetical protein
MRAPFFSMIIVLAAAACGSAPVWQHPEKDFSEYRKDFADCERFFGTTERETERCMIRRGWRRQ